MRFATKHITHAMMVLMVFLILFTVASDTAQAISNFTDNNVDSDSNTDSSTNKGTDGATSYTDAQAIDANDQEIAELNTSAGTYIEDAIDNDSSDIDSSPDIATLSNFGNSQTLDASYATLTEELGSDSSADLTDDEYFLVGSGGSTSFGSPNGTIEMWLKFENITIYGRPWGQNDNFEVRMNSGTITYDFGTTNALVATEPIATINKWYFLAITWNEVDNKLFLFIGDESTVPVEKGNNTDWTSSVSSLPNTENRVFSAHGQNDPVDGKLDEFRYWDTERSLSNIQQDYNITLSGNESGLQHYYQFENSLIDSAGSVDLVPVGAGSFTYESDTSTAIIGGYQLDQEVQFTNIIDFMALEKVNIFAGTTGAEDIEVSYWTGSSWSQLFTDLSPSSWNNVSVSLTSSILTLRFKSFHSVTDNVQDSWQVDVILLTYQGAGQSDDFVDQGSDLDGSSDKGYVNQFSDLQNTDSNYAKFEETTGFNTTAINRESFESSMPWTAAGAWARESNQAFDGVWSADYDGDGISSGTLTTNTIDTSNAIAIYIEFYWFDSGLDNNNLIFRLFNGVGYDDIDDLNTVDSSNGWHKYTTKIDNLTSPQYFISNLRIRWAAIVIGGGNTAAIDYVLFDYEESATSENEIDQEIQFTNVLTTLPKTTLSIYAGNLDAEDIKVEYWSGATWVQLQSDLNANSWNNITVTDYLTSSTFTIRFIDGNKMSDASPDAWFIDSVSLGYISKTTHYELDWEHQTQSIDTTKEFYELTIYGSSSDSTEEFNIQLWNQTSSSWTNSFSSRITNTLQWYNYSIPSGGIIGSSITWRYTGTVDGDVNLYDLNQNTLYIDYAGIASWNEIPIVTVNPADITNYVEGDSPYSLSWTATDSNASSYTIYLDESIDDSGVWTSGIAINYNIDGLLKGSHNYTIVFTDVSGNTISDQVDVIVIDTTNPIVNSPTNVTYEAGATNNWINWTATDNYENNYEIFKNEVLNTTNVWSSGTTIDYNVDGLLPGIHNITVAIYDDSNNIVVDTVYVIVSDGTDPTIDQPDDFSYEAGTLGNVISWDANDVLPNTYTVYRNGSISDSGSWSSAVLINTSIDGLLKGNYNFTIVVIDNLSNKAVDTVIITVVDTTKPAYSYEPANIQFAEGSTGNKVDWIATDIHPSVYFIYQNGTQVDTNTWSTGINITFVLDNELKGTYEFVITVHDTTGNSFNNSVIIVVTDETNPIVTDVADINDYIEGDTGYTITWNTIDSYPDALTIDRDGTVLISGPWTNNSNSKISIDGLEKGTYIFTIIVVDQSGNQIIDTVTVVVNDETEPGKNSPSNFKYPEGSTGNVIEWIGTDLHPDTYIVLKNGTQIAGPTAWVDSGTISINIDGLTEKIYNFTIILSDTTGNSISDIVFVEVTAESVFTSVPDNLFYILDDTGNLLNWTVSDSNPHIYILYREGIEINSSIWKNGIPLSFNVDGLIIGTYNFTLQINDTDNNIIYSQVNVTVSDMPIFWNPPSNISNYIEGNTPYSITWNFTDREPDSYTIYNNSVEVETNTWDNATAVILGIDGLSKGAYNFTIIVYDLTGNYITSTVWVTVLDQTSPIFDAEPSDIPNYIEGTTGKSLTWDISDLYPNNYTIYRNLTELVGSGTWINGENITLNIDGLSVRVYNYTLTIYDVSGNSNISIIWVTVFDETPPSINSPDDVTFSEGSAGPPILWAPIDLHENTYTIYRNETQIIIDQTWTNASGISLDLDSLSLAKGYYNFTVHVKDIYDNSIFDTVWVNVTDDTPPTIDSPADEIFNEGSAGTTILWTPIDLYEDTYTIYRNGTPIVVDQIWTNAGGISLDLDLLSLAKGYYNFSVYVVDLSGNIASDLVWVNVTDATPPSFTTSQSDILDHVEGSGGVTITWEVFDLYPRNYVIYRNLTDLFGSGTWNNGVNITLNIDVNDLDEGTYNFTLTIYDVSGISASHLVWITVIDSDNPILTSTPPPTFQFAEGIPGNSLTWVSTDLHNNTYAIYENMSLVASGNWTSGDSINLNIDYLLKGVYNISIIVYDESGNFDTNMIVVTVNDDTNPVVNDPTSPPDIQYKEGETGISITWNASDNYPDKFVIYKDSSIINSGNWTSGNISISVDGLLLGEYSFSLLINDTTGNLIIDTVIVIVTEEIKPNFTFLTNNFTYSRGEINNEITWTMNDTYPGNYEITRDGSFFASGNWANLTAVTINIDGLIEGQYNFVISVYDSSGNVITDIVQVTVIDTTPPKYEDDRFPYTIEFGTLNQLINWTVTDFSPADYKIYHNNSNGFQQLLFEGLWVSNDTVKFDIDDYLADYLGTHNFTIIFFDQSGNYNRTMNFIKVVDTTSPQFTSEQTQDTIVEGSPPPILEWIATDLINKNYTIYENESKVVQTGGWTSGIPITFSPVLSKGTYNFTIVISDESGNLNISSVIIIVTDKTSPQFGSTPVDAVYDEGSIGHTVSWVMSDNYRDTYEIFKDGEQISINGATWFDNAPVTIPTDGLSTGVYNYTIIIYDASKNSNSSTIIITVYDVTNPEIVISPDLTEYVEGTTGNNLIWKIVDVHPGNYNLTRDGNIIDFSTWISEDNLTINIDNLTAGNYNFTIVIEDQSNNYINSTIWVLVEDKSPPLIATIRAPDHNTVIIGEQNYIEWDVTDLHPSTYLVKRDGFLYIDPTADGIWKNGTAIKIAIDSTTANFYNFTIEIRDESGNVVTDWIIIRVKDPDIIDTIRPEIEITKLVYEGDIEDINGTWTDVDGNAIVNATITAKLYSNFLLMRIITTNTSIDGFYIIYLDYNTKDGVNIVPDDYFWEIEFSKDGYQVWDDIKLDVEVIIHNYQIQLDIPDELVQGEDYIIVALISYDNPEPTVNGSLGLNGLIGRNGTRASGVLVIFTITVIQNDGSEFKIIKNAGTRSTGVAVIRLTGDETANIDSILSIDAKIGKSVVANDIIVLSSESQLPQVMDADPTVLETVLKFWQDNIVLIPIMVILIALSMFGYGLYNKRKRDKIAEINNSVKSANVELLAIQSIQSIIMQTSSKLTIYEEQMAEGELNSTLISGMVTAFSSFLGEIGKNELFGFEMMEREGVSITLHKGEVSNIIIISSEKLPLIVLSQIRDAQMLIESEFKTNFTNTTRGVTKLTRDKIHPLFHKTSFKIDLQDELLFNESNIRKLLKQKSLSRALKANISLLYEFPKSDYFKDNAYKLTDIIRFFQSQGITERVSSRTIILAYQFDVIDSRRNQ